MNIFADNTCEEFCTFDVHSEDPPGRLIDDRLRTMTELGQNSQPTNLQRFVVLVEDLKPRGMKVSFHTFLSQNC
jgi:hypothetical protein